MPRYRSAHRGSRSTLARRTAMRPPATGRTSHRSGTPTRLSITTGADRGQWGHLHAVVEGECVRVPGHASTVGTPPAASESRWRYPLSDPRRLGTQGPLASWWTQDFAALAVERATGATAYAHDIGARQCAHDVRLECRGLRAMTVASRPAKRNAPPPRAGKRSRARGSHPHDTSHLATRLAARTTSIAPDSRLASD